MTKKKVKSKVFAGSFVNQLAGCDTHTTSPELEYYKKKVYSEHDKELAIQEAKAKAANDYTRMKELEIELLNIGSCLTDLKFQTEDYLKAQAKTRAELKEVTTRINDATFKALL